MSTNDLTDPRTPEPNTENLPAAYLRLLPLHALTTSYGLPGLQRRFTIETAHLDASHRRRLNRALELAQHLHHHDTRTTEPYIHHPLRVAIRIASHYRIHDPDVLAAALLHDTVEDHTPELANNTPDRTPDNTPDHASDGAPDGASGDAPDGASDGALDDAQGGASGDLAEAAFHTLTHGFGPRVAALVRAVTNPPFDPGQDRNTQYRQHVINALTRDRWARVIKLSDLTDNGLGIIHTTGPKVQRMAVKYAPLIPPLRDLVRMPDTPLDQPAKTHVLTQLDKAARRFDAITGNSPGPR